MLLLVIFIYINFKINKYLIWFKKANQKSSFSVNDYSNKVTL